MAYGPNCWNCNDDPNIDCEYCKNDDIYPRHPDSHDNGGQGVFIVALSFIFWFIVLCYCHST